MISLKKADYEKTEVEMAEEILADKKAKEK